MWATSVGRILLLISAWVIVIGIGGYATYDLYSYADGKARETANHSSNVERVTNNKIQLECSLADPLAREICFRDHYESRRVSERAEGDLQAQQNMSRATFWIATIAWVQTVIGLGGLYFVIGSVDAAAASANAAKKQIETQIIADRPRLRVVNIVTGTRIPNHLATSIPTHAVVTCDVVNFGKTPAYISDYCFRFRVFDKTPEFPDYDYVRSDNNFIVFPDRPAVRGPYILTEGGRELATFPPISKSSDWEYVGKVVLFYGYFVFEDAFGKKRKIGFGYSISGLSEVNLVGGSAYNYDREET